MDELLYDRVKQLKDIEDRLDKIFRYTNEDVPKKLIRELKQDMLNMIHEAEREHAEF